MFVSDNVCITQVYFQIYETTIKGVPGSFANKEASESHHIGRNENNNFWLDYFQMELEAHTWWFRRGHDPSLLAEYELRTPSESITTNIFGKLFFYIKKKFSAKLPGTPLTLGIPSIPHQIFPFPEPPGPGVPLVGY